ncbi:MAG: hypothetical protein IJY17_02980 [Alphaproteobacteria bacterium]|nr:hypothetical protein [Alphaproteobacteria bacterium]
MARFFCICLIFLTNACTLSETRRNFFVSTDVPAQAALIVGGKKLETKKTPAEFSLVYADTAEILLTAEGCQPLIFSVSKKADSKTRHFTVSREIYTAPAFTFIFPFQLLLLTSGENSFDKEYRRQVYDGVMPGYYYEYAPAYYHVEMIPAVKRRLSVQQKKRLLISDFVFKNFDRLKSGDSEYIKALGRLAGLPEPVIENIFAPVTTPFTAADTVLFESDEASADVSGIEERHWQLFLISYQIFDQIKAENPAYLTYLSLRTGIPETELKVIALKSAGPGQFVVELGRQYYNLYYQGFGRQCRGEFCTAKKEKPEYWNRRLLQQVGEIERIMKETPA